MRVLVVAALALSLPACGTPARVLVDETPTDSPTVSALPSLPTLLPSAQPTPSRTPGPGKKVYSDSTYGYSLEYPSQFSVEEIDPPSGRVGETKIVRFYDPKFEGKYPDGQVQAEVFIKDAEDLRVWLSKHTQGPNDSDSGTRYFRAVGDVTAAHVAEREAISFLWRPPEGGDVAPLFTKAVFIGDYVLTLAYFGLGEYETTIKAIFENVVASVRITNS